jgi:hypothetical protein
MASRPLCPVSGRCDNACAFPDPIVLAIVSARQGGLAA